MDHRLIEELRQEEDAILVSLRATAPFRRLEALRRVLSHYDAPPPIGAQLDALLPDGARPAMLSAASQAAVIPLPGPRVDVA